jgi:hypothetical protein
LQTRHPLIRWSTNKDHAMTDCIALIALMQCIFNAGRAPSYHFDYYRMHLHIAGAWRCLPNAPGLHYPPLQEFIHKTCHQHHFRWPTLRSCRCISNRPLAPLQYLVSLSVHSRTKSSLIKLSLWQTIEDPAACCRWPSKPKRSTSPPPAISGIEWLLS